MGSSPGTPAPPSTPTPSQEAATANASRGTSRNTGTTQQFTLTDGEHTETFGSRLEADAQFVRSGRRGVVGPA